MKESKGKRKRKGPAEDGHDTPALSYTPEQRRIIRKGLRIWARVAIRSYMRKRAAATLREEDSGEDAQVEV